MFIPQRTPLCLLFVLMMFTPAHAEIYKWIDAEALTNYSHNPPEDRPFEIISVPPPPALSKQKPSEEIEALMQDLDAAEQAREVEQLKEKQQAALDAFRQENCEIAQQNLQTYQNNPGRRFINEAGEVSRPTEEERQLKIDQFSQEVDKLC